MAKLVISWETVTKHTAEVDPAELIKLAEVEINQMEGDEYDEYKTLTDALKRGRVPRDYTELFECFDLEAWLSEVGQRSGVRTSSELNDVDEVRLRFAR